MSSLMDNRTETSALAELFLDGRLFLSFLLIHSVLLTSVFGRMGLMYVLPFFFFAWAALCLGYKLRRSRGLLRPEVVWPFAIILLTQLTTLALTGVDSAALSHLSATLTLLIGVYCCGAEKTQGLFEAFLVLLVLFDGMCLARAFVAETDVVLGVAQGLSPTDGALCGISISCNQLAAINLCGFFIVSLLMARLRGMRAPWRRAILSFCGVVCFLFLAVSGCRAVNIALVIAAFFVGAASFAGLFSGRRACVWGALLGGLVAGCIAWTVTEAVFEGWKALIRHIGIQSFIPSSISLPSWAGEVDAAPEVVSTGLLHRADEILSGRPTIWLRSLTIWEHRPLFGVGQSNLRALYNAAFGSGDPNYPYEYLHNGYLQILVANGVAGLCGFVLLVVMRARDWLKSFARSLSRPTCASVETALLFGFLLSLFAYNLVEGNFFYELKHVAILFWLFAAMLDDRIQNQKAL